MSYGVCVSGCVSSLPCGCAVMLTDFVLSRESAAFSQDPSVNKRIFPTLEVTSVQTYILFKFSCRHKCWLLGTDSSSK